MQNSALQNALQAFLSAFDSYKEILHEGTQDFRSWSSNSTIKAFYFTGLKELPYIEEGINPFKTLLNISSSSADIMLKEDREKANKEIAEAEATKPGFLKKTIEISELATQRLLEFKTALVAELSKSLKPGYDPEVKAKLDSLSKGTTLMKLGKALTEMRSWSTNFHSFVDPSSLPDIDRVRNFQSHIPAEMGEFLK